MVQQTKAAFSHSERVFVLESSACLLACFLVLVSAACSSTGLSETRGRYLGMYVNVETNNT